MCVLIYKTVFHFAAFFSKYWFEDPYVSMCTSISVCTSFLTNALYSVLCAQTLVFRICFMRDRHSGCPSVLTYVLLQGPSSYLSIYKAA